MCIRDSPRTHRHGGEKMHPRSICARRMRGVAERPSMFGIEFSAAEEQFRQELRDWLARNLPCEGVPDDEAERREFQRAWQRRLAADRWVGIQWPVEHGGRGAQLNEQIIFTEERVFFFKQKTAYEMLRSLVGS